MAKRYITQMLSEKLGAYLDGLDSTDIKFTMSEALLQLENVVFKEDALTKLKLPVKIKHGMVRKLDVRVPWRTISSSPVQIKFEGIDLLLTPQMSDAWEFTDIYSPQYLADTLQALIQEAILEHSTEAQQSYLDGFKFKVLDNIKVRISEVHIRVEHYIPAQKLSANHETKQSSFGILLRSFDICTTDKDDKEIFHDRTQSKTSIFKRISLEGLASYLNPFDPVMIHRIPFRINKVQAETSAKMKEVIKQYIQLTDAKEDERVLDDPALIYILRPLSLRVIVQRRIEKPEKLHVEITLDQFSLQFLYNQLKAMLVFAQLAQKYKLRASEQEKVKKYRFLRQPSMNAKQRWKFAIECIRRSIRTKNGALTAFTIPETKLEEFERKFKPLLVQYYHTPDAQKNQLVHQQFTLAQKQQFCLTLEALPPSKITEWIQKYVLPLQRQKEKEQPKEGGGWLSWIYGSSTTAQQEQADDDNLDEFFDCEEEHTEESDLLGTRERTSLEVVYEVKELTLLLAKINSQNKLDGIQMYNRGAYIHLTSPTLNLDQFQMSCNFQESGVNLVTIDRETGYYQDCTSAIQQNKSQLQKSNLNNQSRPQLTLEVKKGGKELDKDGIEFDIKLQVDSIVYKHYEDLIIRAKAISNVKIDEEIQSAALGTLEDLRETTQNRLHEMLYKRKNRYLISIESPVIILPIYATFEGKHAPVWVIRTGNMVIMSEDVKSKQVQAVKFANKLTGVAVSEDVYEGYKINVTSIGLHYFSSYDGYQKSQVKKIVSYQNEPTAVFAGQTLPIMPARFHEFTDQQQQHLNQKKASQTMKEFSVLEDFEIRVSLKTLKKSPKSTNAAVTDLDIQTTPILINFSHNIYNQLVNFSNIFNISKEKQKDFAKEVESYQMLIRQEITQNTVFEGEIRRLIAQSVIWEDNYAVLSGRYLYIYQDRNSPGYLDYIEVKGAEISKQGLQITISNQGAKHSFIPKDISWENELKQQIFKLHVKDFSEQGDNVQQQVNKRKTEIKRIAVNSEQVQMKVQVQVPSLKLQLLRMILMPGTKIIKQPAEFEDWVTIAFLGMQMSLVDRSFDSVKHIKFQQITLSDCTMPQMHQTLISQSIVNQGADSNTQHSLEIVINNATEESSKYQGILNDMQVTLINVNFKFMPGSINQILKLLRSTKLQSQPTDKDSKEQHERKLIITNIPDHESDDYSRRLTNLPDQRVNQSVESTKQNQEKFFEYNCQQKQTQTSRTRVTVNNISITMLHHKYTMPLYSMDSSKMNIEMNEWYDHSSFACQMSELRLCDLTNYPYTSSPKVYYEAVQKGLEPQKITPNELIRCKEFEFKLQSFQSSKCALKHPDYNNKLYMRISPFRINFVQEVLMRFIEYFQQRFVDSLTMSDPYQNPKEEFEARQRRQGIPIDKINSKTDFKQPTQVDFMDIQIKKAEIFARDRPFSQNYILISSPLIKVESQLVKTLGRFPFRSEIELGLQRYKIELQTINFWYGISKHRKDRLSLLKQTFNVKIAFDALLYSELLEKIDIRQMDKSTNVTIQFDPFMLVLPQAVYTYILRCNDLNFGWTDRLQAEFYCVKWIHMTDYYKQLKKVVAQKLKIEIPLLSLTLKHTDGSFISELLLKAFRLDMIRFMDGASNQNILCSKFFILDKIPQENSQKKQAIVCPWNSQLIIDPLLQKNKLTEEEMQQESQLTVTLKMKASGDKKITINITGLKIFLKMPLFIMLQGYFLNAFPKYNQDDIDKPVGFVGNDPDNTSRMVMQLKIHKSLICLLNQPGFKSIACQGEIELETMQENITKIKQSYNSLGGARHDSIDRSLSINSDKEPQSDNVYTMKLTVSELTPYICSLSHLESGEIDFSQINKRQLFSPLDLSLVQNLTLTPVTDQDYQETGEWGVTSKTSIKIGKFQLKLSILDLHLILQVTAYASEQMAKETVYRLQEIEMSIDKEFLSKLKSEELCDAEEQKDPEFNQLKTSQRKMTIAEAKENKKKEFFENLINKFQESNTDSMQTVVERLTQTTNQFKKLTQGYTGQSYNERETFLQFITKDILQRDDDMPDLKDDAIAQKTHQPVIQQRVLTPHDSDDQNQEDSDVDSDKFFDVTEGNSQYTNLIQAERKKLSLYQGFKAIQHSAQTPKQMKNLLGSASSKTPSNNLSSLLGKRQQSIYSNSIKKGSRTPKSQKSEQSDDQDEFHSARGSFESYQDAVENALDTFYSFHEKREPVIAQTDNPPFYNYNDDEVTIEEVDQKDYQAIESIRETMAEQVRSNSELNKDLQSEESSQSEIQQPRPSQDIVRQESIVVKSTISNVLEDIKDMYCEQIQILAINDYNCGFTPVLQLEFSKILMNQSWKSNNQAETGLVLPEILINYYNIELGEWEPLLEKTQMAYDQLTTTTSSTTTITMKEAINLNSTEECLRNLFYTYESWMKTPQFFQQPKNKKTSKKSTSKNQHNKSQINFSDVDEEDDDHIFKGLNNNNKVFISQMRESLIHERPEYLNQVRKEGSEQMLFTSHISEENIDDLISDSGQPKSSIKQNNQHLVTPFSIVNYTPRRVKIVRGGIKPGQFGEIRNFQQSSTIIKDENQSVYVLNPSMQTDYAVTYGRLMGIQSTNVRVKNRQDEIRMSMNSRSLDEEEDSQTVRTSEVSDQVLQQRLQKLKNNEIIGIQLSDLDYVPFVDLNRNTGLNPWVHEISTQVQQTNNKSPTQVDVVTPLLEGYDKVDDHSTNQIKNKVFYGTLLKGMRKFLVIRAPYCIVNKTSFLFEIKIHNSRTKILKHTEKIPQGGQIGLDDAYLSGHQLSIRMIKENAVENDLGWSEKVLISTLLELPFNEGTGQYISNYDTQQITTCIKRVNGEINGTIDLVLLPTITIRNCLPCSMLVRQRQIGDKGSIVNVSTGFYIDQQQIEQSQEKQFHIFSPIKVKDFEEFQLQIGVDGFVFTNLDLKLMQTSIVDEIDFEIADEAGNTLRIGVRQQYTKAGIHLTFYAHACVLLESIHVLPFMKIFYKGGNFHQRRVLANPDEMRTRKYIMCNKDADIVVGIQDSVNSARITYSFSQDLDLKEAGKQTQFSVMTLPQANAYQANQCRYDFVCTPNLQLANFEEQIFTKVVSITPQYIIFNKTKTSIEVAQSENINALSEQDRILKVQEKREWHWPVGNLPEETLKIVIKKIQPLQQKPQKGVQNQLIIPSEDEQDKSKSKRRFSDSDKVIDWNWSRPISLNINKDQVQFPIAICEKQGTRKKIYLISKKVINTTTFITISEETKFIQPFYLIRNNCPNLRLSFQQDQQPVPETWKLQELQQISYAHLDPQSRIVSATFNLTIDKSVKKWSFKHVHCFERQLPYVSLDREFSEEIRYNDLSNKERCIRVTLTNDGLTKKLTFSLDGESQVKKQNENQQIQKKKEPVSTIKCTTLNVKIAQLSISVIGYTNTAITHQSLKKEFQTRRERNEIALFTISELSLKQFANLVTNSQQINLDISKFQVDNQSSQNPLFHTILMKKNNSQHSTPFLFFVCKYQYNEEANITTIDLFDLQMAEYVLRIDDTFLINISNAMITAATMYQSNESKVHPLFMKDSFYEKLGYLDLCIKNMQYDCLEDEEDPFKQKDQLFRQKANGRHRNTIKQQPLGVVTVSEIRFNQKIEDVPVAFRHWIMQDKSLETGGKLELTHLKISKIVIELTFIFRTKDKKNKIDGPMNYLQSSGFKLASIDELSLKLDEFLIENRFVAMQDFNTQIYDFYVNSIWSQVIKSVFTIKALGSLPNFAGHVANGVVNLIEVPRQGFNQNWYRGVGGIFVGFGSLFKHSFIGLFGFTQVLGESYSEILLALGLDRDYAMKHEEEVLTQRPKNFVEGLGFGASSALQSIPDAIICFFSRPVIEGQRNGKVGVLSGLYQGFSGLILKPLAGGLDFIAKTSEGFKNTLRIFDQKQKKGRIRMPRTFYGIQRRIKAFSEDDAFIVSNVLCYLKNGEFAQDHYIDMKLIRTANDNRAPHFLLLSEENLFLIEASQKQIVWHIEQKHIVKIQNMSNGLLINLKENEDYAGRAQVGLPLDGQSSVEINQWFGQIMSDQF